MADLKLKLYYSAGQLKAEWNTAPEHYGYELNVYDSADILVFSKQILLADYVAPVTIRSDTFQPQAGASYSAKVFVINAPSPSQPVEIIDLDKTAQVTVTAAGGGVQVNWDTQTRATGYDVQVLKATVIITKENQPAPPLLLKSADGLEEGTDYTVQVRARAGNAYGDWSDAVALKLLSAAAILQELQQRLQANQPDQNSLVLNEITLPSATAGNPATLLKLLQENLQVQSLTIQITTPLAMNQAVTELSFAGIADFLTTAQSKLNFVFSVSESSELSLSLHITPGTNWSFAKNFPAAKLGEMEFWQIKDPQFVLTSQDVQETAIFFPLKTGLNFLGTLQVANDLTPMGEALSPETTQNMPFGGPITRSASGIEFHFTGQNNFADLTLKPIGQTPLVLKNGALKLDSVAATQPDTGNTNSFRIEGNMALPFAPLTCALSIPGKYTQNVTATFMPGTTVFDDVSKFLEAGTTAEIKTAMPSTLLALAQVELKAFSITFAPDASQTTIIRRQIGIPDWGLSVFTLKSPKLNLVTYLSPNGAKEPMRADQITIAAKLGISTAEFDISLAAGFRSDWVLTIQNNQPDLQNLATLIGRAAGMFTSDLPKQLQDLGNFVPTEVQVAFDPYPETAVFKYLRFKIDQIAKWPVIAGLLEVDRWHIQVRFDKVGDDWKPSSLLNGDIVLAGHPVHVDLSIPPDEEGWTFQFAQEPMTIPGFGDLLKLLGAEQAANLLPDGVRNLGNLTITQLAINVDFSGNTPQVRSISFQIHTPSIWTLIPTDKLVINSIETGMTIARTGTDFAAIGFIRGIVTVANVPVFIMAQRLNPADPWILELATTKVIHIPGLAEIAAWMFPDQMQSYIPTAFMPFPDGLDLTDFNLALDLTNNKLTLVKFVIWNSKAWQIIPNSDYLTIDDVMIAASIEDPLGTSGLTATIQGTVYLGTLGVVLAATKANPETPWHFSGAAEPDTELDFESFFRQVTPGIAIPYDFGFPRSITLKTASAEAIPADSTFHFKLDTVFNWKFNFGVTVLEIQALNGELDVKAPDEKGIRPYTFAAGGQFTLAGLTARLIFNTSNGVTDTIFQATITPEQLANFRPGTLSDELTTTPVEGVKYDSLPIPQGTGITFSEARIFINLTKKVFLLSGSAQNFGSAAFLAFQLADAQWAYFIGAALADTFTFESIHSSLKPLDGVLHVVQAGFSIVSHDTDSLQDLVRGQSDLRAVVPVTADAKPIPLKAGVNFYGKLEFTGTIFQNTTQLLTGVQQKPNIAIYAFISKVPEDRVFKAWLGQFTLFNFLDFDQIELAYYPNKLNELQLNGRITAVLSTTQQYQFDGAMTVNDKKALFAGSLVLQQPAGGNHGAQPKENAIAVPLGMTGITLESLNFAVDHTFGNTTSPTIIRLSGTVGFGAQRLDGTYPVALTGNLFWVGPSPVLVEIALSQPLDLLMFFTTVFASEPAAGDGSTYLSGQSTLTLLQGRMYYYKSPDSTNLTYNAATYKPGFNLETKISLFSKNVNLRVQVLDGQTVVGLTGPQSGVIAEGSFEDPITLWFMGFYDSTFTTSPALLLNVLTSRKAFGLDVGLKLFDEQFATGTVTVGKTEGVKDAQLLAEFTYVGSIEILKYSKLAFTYSVSEGFNLKNLPFHSNVPLDLAGLRQAISTLQGGCAEIIDKGFEQLIKTNFLIKPKMKDQGDNALHVTLTGIYALSLIDASHPFLFVDMPEITLTISKDDNLTLSKLPAYLIRQIVANSGSIIAQLISQPVKLSALISVLGAQALAKGIISHLVCDMETVEESAEAAEEASQAAEAAEEAAQALESAEETGAAADEIADLAAAAAEAAEAAMAAGAASGAGTGAAGTVATGLAVVAGAGIGGVLAGFISSLFGSSKPNSGGSSTGGGGSTGGSSTGGSSGGKSTQPPPVRPKLDKVANIQFPPVDENTLRVTWQGLTIPSYYQVSLKGGTANKMQTTGGTQSDFTVSDLPAGQYHVEIIAYASEYRPSDAAISGDFWKVAAPTLKPLQLSGQNITCQVDQTQSGATSYEAQLITNKAPFSVIQTLSGTPPQTQFTISDMTAKYTVQVRSMVIQGVPSTWLTAAQTIEPLAGPQLEALAFNNGQLTATLAQNVPGANSYNAQLIVDGKPGDMVAMQRSAQQPDKWIAQFTISPETTALNYQVKVQALGSNALPSVWVTSTDQITHLSQPSIGSPSLHIGGMLIYIQTMVPGAEHYQARLVIDGVPQETTVDVPAATAGNSYLASFVITDTTPGMDFKVEARALASNALPSFWAIGTVGVARVASPDIQSLTYDEPSGKLMILLTAAIPDATGYETQLVVDGGPQTYYGSREDDPAIPQPRFAIFMNPQINGTSFQVRARARAAGRLASIWKTSTPSLAKLSEPQLAPLSLVRNNLVARLPTPVPNAQRYATMLLIDGNSSGDPLDMTSAPDNPNVLQASFPVPIDVDQPAGMEYKVQVRAFAEGFLPSSYSVSAPLQRLESPDLRPLQYANEKLTATLANTVPHAEYYQARLVMSGSPLDNIASMQQSTQDPTQFSADFGISNEAAGLAYQAQARAMAANYVPSIWKTSADSLTIIGVPHNVKLNLSAQKDVVEVNWDAVPNVPDYEVQITDAAGQPLPNQPDFTAKESQNNVVIWRFPIPADFPAGGIRAHVQAKALNQFSAWSALSEVILLSGLPIILGDPVAYYPLSRDAKDASGHQVDMTLMNVIFEEGGIYCNGIYIFKDSDTPAPDACHAITPKLSGLDFSSIYISANFKVSELLDHGPVFVGGNSSRWMGVILNPDGTLALLYNNIQTVSSQVKYSLNEWHNVLVTYDGSIGNLYFDNVLACSAQFQLAAPADSNVSITNFGSGKVFKGIFKDLKIGQWIAVKNSSNSSDVETKRITLVAAQASSELQESYNGKPQTAARLLENEDHTFWNSDDTGKDPTPWFWVELNERSIVQELKIRWKAQFGELEARAMKYRVFCSLDAQTWTDTGRSQADVNNLSTQLDQDTIPGWSSPTKYIKVAMSDSSYPDGYFTCHGVEVWGIPDDTPQSPI